MSQARTSPAGPVGGFSWVRPPVRIRLRYIVGGEASELLPDKPRRFSSVFRLMLPPSPNAGLGVPDFASMEKSRPLLVPNTSCGGVFASPGQYSTPRDVGELFGTWKTHTSL